jgi:hypothetical protein
MIDPRRGPGSTLRDEQDKKSRVDAVEDLLRNGSLEAHMFCSGSKANKGLQHCL